MDLEAKHLNILIDGCKSSNRKSQKELYLLCQPLIRSLARRHLVNKEYVNDITQEIFLKLFNKISYYDYSKGTFKNWLFTLSINTIYDHNKKMKTKYKNQVSIDTDFSRKIAVMEDGVFQLNKEDLFRLIDLMPQSYRAVFNFHVIDGLSHEEISKLLGCNTSVSRKRLSRGRQWLKEQLFLSEKKVSNGK